MGFFSGWRKRKTDPGGEGGGGGVGSSAAGGKKGKSKKKTTSSTSSIGTAGLVASAGGAAISGKSSRKTSPRGSAKVSSKSKSGKSSRSGAGKTLTSRERRHLKEKKLKEKYRSLPVIGMSSDDVLISTLPKDRRARRRLMDIARKEQLSDFPELKAKTGWLAHNVESGQSYRDFVDRKQRLSPTVDRSVIYILPVVGDPDPKRYRRLHDLIGEFVGIFFQMQAKVMPRVTLTELGEKSELLTRVFRGEKQYYTRTLFQAAHPLIPDDAFCMEAILEEDIFSRFERSFVFGSAKLAGRIGVYSFHRHRPEFYGHDVTQDEHSSTGVEASSSSATTGGTSSSALTSSSAEGTMSSTSSMSDEGGSGDESSFSSSSSSDESDDEDEDESSYSLSSSASSHDGGAEARDALLARIRPAAADALDDGGDEASTSAADDGDKDRGATSGKRATGALETAKRKQAAVARERRRKAKSSAGKRSAPRAKSRPPREPVTGPLMGTRARTNLELLTFRALKTCVHEIGHMFFLKHCIDFNCCMNGSIDVAESDRRSPHLCPVCLRKLQYAVGFDPLVRYRELHDFYARNGMSKEAMFVQRRVRVIEAAATEADTDSD